MARLASLFKSGRNTLQSSPGRASGSTESSPRGDRNKTNPFKVVKSERQTPLTSSASSIEISNIVDIPRDPLRTPERSSLSLPSTSSEPQRNSEERDDAYILRSVPWSSRSHARSGHIRTASDSSPPRHPLARSRSKTTSNADFKPIDATPTKHRPTALRLRTSNLLSPTREVTSDSKYPSTLLPYAQRVREDAGAVEVLGPEDTHTPRPPTPGAEASRASVSTPRHRYMQHTRSSSSLTSSTSLPLSTPFAPTPTRPFENVPLPWTSQSIEELTKILGQDGVDQLVDFTLSHLPPRPNLLPPSLLRASATEESRLRTELARLREKYERLVQQRDALLHQLEQSFIKTDLSTVQRALASVQNATLRCDRIARQMYVCNDQIRQIELQGESHIVGAVQVALSRQITRNGTNQTTTTSSAGPLHEQAATDLGLNQLDFFPLPPDVPSPIEDQPSPEDAQIMVDRADDNGAIMDEILIFPPSHRRSESLPILSIGVSDLPRTPRLARQEASSSSSSTDSSRVTAPLRIATHKVHRKARARSLHMKKQSSDAQKRTRRGRDTQLHTAESILLSLATAELWTKEARNVPS